MDVRSEAVCVSGFIHLRVRDDGRREEDKMERPRVDKSAVLLQTPPVLGVVLIILLLGTGTEWMGDEKDLGRESRELTARHHPCRNPKTLSSHFLE